MNAKNLKQTMILFVLNTFLIVGIILVANIIGKSVYAAGFEKAVMWSAEWSSLAGAATSKVEGADALFFNPAGLTEGRQREASLNFSPTASKFTGPNTTNNNRQKGEQNISPVSGILYTQKINDKASFGLGTYVAGGSSASYEKVDFSNVSPMLDTLKPDIKSEIQVIEASIGGAYKITKNFSIGASWRASFVNAEMASAEVITHPKFGKMLVATEIKDLKDENYNGYRLGAQYHSNNRKWGVGASYRSNVDFVAEGKATVKVESAMTNMAPVSTQVDNKDAAISNSFPEQYTIGAYKQFGKYTTLLSEYDFTKYSRNEKVKVTGGVNSEIKQNWKDMHNAKLGIVYSGIKNVALRAGYAQTSQVTPSNAARSTFSSPGKGHTIALGSGTSLLKGKLLLDFAGETSFAKGTSTDANLKGEYSSVAYSAHTSLKYNF